MIPEYVALHNHNEYSLLDGMGKSVTWVEAAQELKMKSLGLTNHNNLLGMVKHYNECNKAGIKPIIGIEATLTRDIQDKNKNSLVTNRDILIFPKDRKQLVKLNKIVTKANIEGFYYKPRIDWKMLEECSGMIVTTACRRGVVNKMLLTDHYEKAIKEYNKLIDIFGSKNVYLEVQPQYDNDQHTLNARLEGFDNNHLIIGCDSHYPYYDDYKVHNILLLLQTYKTIKDLKENPGKVMHFNRGYHLMSAKEVLTGLRTSLSKPMAKLAMRNTIALAEQCNIDLKLGKLRIPSFSSNPNEDFTYIVTNIFKEFKYKNLSKPDKDGYEVHRKVYDERFNREYNTIIKMGLADFFLTINDIVEFCIQNNVNIRARGSVAGSLIAYLMKITDVDPIKYNLMFERFLNESRTKLHDIPDIDMDLQDNQRDLAKQYLMKTWGNDRVVNICTFGTMGARGVLKDVARVYGIGFDETNVITKYIDYEVSLKDAINIPEVAAFCDKHPKVYRAAMKLEGQVRHIGGHAAGVVITPHSYWNYFHVVKSKNNLLTSLDMDDLKDMGLLKLDLLGSKMLRIFDDTEKLIGNEDIKLDKISYTKPEIYRAFAEGNSLGVFQFSRWHFSKLLQDIRPKNIEELAAVNTLGRPGAKLTGQDTVYIKGKKSSKYIEQYDIPILKDILSSTYGSIIFQEQVMEICHRVGGLTLNETNDIRESIKHFNHKKMASYGKRFMDYAVHTLGYHKPEVMRLWHDVQNHSNYSFNKSHAVCYSMMSYYSMYLKTLFPYEYMVALLNSAGNRDELIEFIRECLRMKLVIKPPNVFKSGKSFTLGIISKGGNCKQFIREALTSIKGIGDKTADKIISLRDEKNFPKCVPVGIAKKLDEGGVIWDQQ